MRPIREIIKFEAKLWIALFAIGGVISVVTSLSGNSSQQTFTMPNQSMAPTIEKGDRMRVDMAAYSTDDPAVGDLALFIPNDNEDLRWVFRVAAVPGDKLTYSEVGALERNGSQIHPPAPLADQTFRSSERMKVGYSIEFPYTLKESEYFFLSDDPSHLHDSRYWGTIDRNSIIGKLTSH